MSEWREQEWRIPRKEEIVKDSDGNLGRVLRSEGTLTKRKLWIADVNGTEIYSGEDAESFIVADLNTSIKFHNQEYDLMGYRVGALCSYKTNMNIPLEILQMDWSNIRYRMTFCLRDLRYFDSEIMKTDDFTVIPLFDNSFPTREGIFSTHETGLNYRLQVNLVETMANGWTNAGSAWEFNDKNSALMEVDSWKSRLAIRRVSSVLNSNWKVEFPCWSVEVMKNEDDIKVRAVEVKSFNGSPGYFKTALHAAYATKIITPLEWYNAISYSQDIFNV